MENEAVTSLLKKDYKEASNKILDLLCSIATGFNSNNPSCEKLNTKRFYCDFIDILMRMDFFFVLNLSVIKKS